VKSLVPYFLIFHIVTACPKSSISFLISSRFAVTWMCLRTILKLLSCFDLYVWNSVFLLFSSFTNSFTMLTYAMELLGWILICSFMIFISYSSKTTSFSCYDNDEKLLILTTKMDKSLTVFSLCCCSRRRIPLWLERISCRQGFA